MPMEYATDPKMTMEGLSKSRLGSVAGRINYLIDKVNNISASARSTRDAVFGPATEATRDHLDGSIRGHDAGSRLDGINRNLDRLETSLEELQTLVFHLGEL